MPSTREMLVWLGLAALVAALLVVPLMKLRARFVRTAVITDLSAPSTQTVSVAFTPVSMRWTVFGHVQGTGTVMVPHVFSNQVTASFAVRSQGDYFQPDVALIFVPEGQAKGKITGTFRLLGLE